jgi:hypothetical protein
MRPRIAFQNIFSSVDHLSREKKLVSKLLQQKEAEIAHLEFKYP